MVIEANQKTDKIKYYYIDYLTHVRQVKDYCVIPMSQIVVNSNRVHDFVSCG